MKKKFCGGCVISSDSQNLKKGIDKLDISQSLFKTWPESHGWSMIVL